jgi:hypothetical protein
MKEGVLVQAPVPHIHTHTHTKIIIREFPVNKFDSLKEMGNFLEKIQLIRMS